MKGRQVWGKGTLPTCLGYCVGTSLGHTGLGNSPKVFTSKAISGAKWCPWLRADWDRLTADERCDPRLCPPDMAAVFKRCYFAHVSCPLLHQGATRKHESGSLEAHSKRARLAIGKYWGGEDID